MFILNIISLVFCWVKVFLFVFYFLSFFMFLFKTISYNVGMTTNVNIVPTNKPPISAIAIGLNISPPAITNGIKPITVVVVLKTIGENFLSTALSQA